jgi:hypothetical protein
MWQHVGEEPNNLVDPEKPMYVLWNFDAIWCKREMQLLSVRWPPSYVSELITVA